MQTRTRQKPRRRETSHDVSKPRRRRPTQRHAEARRLIKEIRVLDAERIIASSPVGRELLRLSDLRSKARFREQFASLALTTTRQDAKRAWEHHRNVCRQSLHQQFGSAHSALKTAEARERKAVRLHGEAVTARELADVELRLLVEAAR